MYWYYGMDIKNLSQVKGRTWSGLNAMYIMKFDGVCVWMWYHEWWNVQSESCQLSVSVGIKVWRSDLLCVNIIMIQVSLWLWLGTIVWYKYVTQYYLIPIVLWRTIYLWCWYILVFIFNAHQSPIGFMWLVQRLCVFFSQ